MFRGPPRRPFRLVIHVPVSTLSVEHGLLKKTFVAGLIARAASIFRVDELALYMDPDADVRDLKIFREVLRYMATPPYLRRRVIPRSRALRFAGILPPLATPNHPTEDDVYRNHVREGVVVEVPSWGRVCIDAGLDRIYCINHDKSIKIGEGDIVLVRVENGSIKSIVPWSSVEGVYWIYRFTVYRSLYQSIKSYRGPLIISSRKGGTLGEVSGELQELLEGVEALSVVFGSPERDPDEIATQEGWSIDEFRHVSLNSAPLQGVRSIRTYEAVYITLSLLNTFLYDSKGI